MKVDLCALSEQWIMCNIGYGVFSTVLFFLRIVPYRLPHVFCVFDSVIIRYIKSYPEGNVLHFC